MFDSLSDRLNDTFDRLRGKGKLTEADITSAMRDIRMALLEADVNFKVVKEFVAKTKERCMTAEVMESLSPAQNVVKIVLDELTELLGRTDSKLVLGSLIYPKYITADYILQYVRAMQNTIGSNVETLYHILDGRAEALEFKVEKDSPVIGKPIMELKLKDNLLLACLNRNGKVIIPRGQDVICEGDYVVVVTTHTGFTDVSDILKWQ